MIIFLYRKFYRNYLEVNYLIGGVEEAVRDVLDYLVVSAEDISKSNG